MAPFASLLRWSPLLVVASLAACDGDPPVACGDTPVQTLFVRQTAEIRPCFEDPDGEKLTLSVRSSDPEIAIVVVLGLGSKIKILAMSQGRATLTVTAADPGGGTASMEIDVLVPNRSPSASGMLPPVRTLEAGGWVTTVNGRFDDPDEDELTYSVSPANPAVATAEIVDSVRLLVTGVAAGTTTVTVTATDPWGLSAKLDAEVAVLEPVRFFREDFDSSDNLSDWRKVDFWSVSDGRLRLRGSLQRTVNAADWEFKTAMGNDGDRITAGLYSYNTGSPLAYWFSIGYAESFLGLDESDYRMLTCNADRCVAEEGWWGTSDAIADVGELTEVTWTARGDLTAVAGSTLLVSVDMAARDWTTHMGEAWLVAYALASGEIEDRGFFDWVELNGSNADADWHSGPPDIDMSELSKAGPGVGIPSVEVWKK